MLNNHEKHDSVFLSELLEELSKRQSLETREIYDLFPSMNPKTVSWKLFDLVKKGYLIRFAQGYYSISEPKESNATVYKYLNSLSKKIYNDLLGYGFNFYISGLDALVGELLHIPEKFMVLLVIEKSGIPEIREFLNSQDLLVVTEKEKRKQGFQLIKDRADVCIFGGKDFSLQKEHIAKKEKGFIDLYYAVTRLDYPVSIPELSRIYENLLRNRSVTFMKMKQAAKDKGIYSEITWLLEITKKPTKVKEFMSYQLKENL